MADAAGKDKKDRLRICTIKEIVDTERAYLNTLEFISTCIQDKMKKVQNEHSEFTDDMIESIVLNAKNLQKLHTSVVAAFEPIVADGIKADLKVAQVFMGYKNELRMEYSVYGSNYERAQAIVSEVMKREPFKSFFETQLREIGKTATIANVQGVFLSPVQRVCKYPLLLRELTKHTDEDHPDYSDCVNACEVMKEVCSVINEARRRMEKLEEIMDWQSGVDGWEGPNLVDTCNELLKCGVLLKITASKAQERQFFLFDHLLVMCKKLEGKRKKAKGAPASKSIESSTCVSGMNSANAYQFKGSVLLDMLEIDEMVERPGFVSNNVHYQYGWRIQDKDKKKAFMCMAQTANERQEWVDSILAEREKVRAFKLKNLQDSYVLIAARGDRIYKSMRKANIIRDHKSVIGIKGGENKCFSGMEFVQFMLESTECRSEEEAVELGCSLVSNGIIHHVSDKCHFKNENFLYRFRFDDGTFEARVESSALSRKTLQYYVRLHLLANPIVRDVVKKLGATIKNCFSGKDLVDFLVAHNDFTSREDAVTCCEEMLGENLLHHVEGKNQFRERDDMYYRFCTDFENKDKPDYVGSDVRQVLAKSSECTTRSINIRPGTDTLGFSINSNRPNIVSSVVPTGIAATQGLSPGAMIHTVNGCLVAGLDLNAFVKLLKDRVTWLTLTYVTAPTDVKNLLVGPGEKYGFCISGSQPSSVFHVLPDSPAARAGLFAGLAIVKVDDHDTTQAALPVTTKLIFGRSLDEEDMPVSTPATSSSNYAMQPPSSVPAIVIDTLNTTDPQTDVIQMLSWTPESTEKIEIGVSLPDIIHNSMYQYAAPSGSTVSVLERSVESLFSYSLPAMLYTLWAEEDMAHADDIGRLCDTLPADNPFSPNLTRYSRRFLRHVDTYRSFDRNLRTTHYPSFKAVKDATRVSHAGCPMNCHTYEIAVDTTTTGGETHRSVHHSVICASPSAVHQMGNGGLQTRVATLTMILGYREKLVDSRKVIERLSRLIEHIRPDTAGEDSLPPLPSQHGYGASLGISSRSHSLTSIISSISEDEDGTASLDFSTVSLDTAIVSAAARAMTFSAEVTSYLASCVNKSTVNAYLITDGILSSNTTSTNFSQGERKTSVTQYLDSTLSPQLKAIASSLSTVNSLTKEVERLKMLIAAEDPKYEQLVQEIFDNVNILNNESMYRLIIGIAQEDDIELVERRDAVFSQVMASFMTGFMAQLEAALAGDLNPLPEHNSDSEVMSNRWLLQLAACGVLAEYELIIDPTVDGEMAMLEDAVPAVAMLENVSISIRRWTKKMADDEKSWNKAIVDVVGNRSKLDVYVYLDDTRYKKIPPCLQRSTVKITPCVFSGSLNPLSREAMASSEGRRTFQVSCNITSVDKMRDYYTQFRSCVLDKSRLPENPEDKMVEIDRLLKPLHTLGETISALSKTVEFGKGDNMYNSAAVLTLASEVTHRCGGVRISTSRNGYSRNSYTTTLDAAMLLCRSHELPLANLRKACDLLRSEGVLFRTLNKNGLLKFPVTRDLLPICMPPAFATTKSDDLAQPNAVKKGRGKSIFRKKA